MGSRKLIAIVGPTASGKTRLAIDIAQRRGGRGRMTLATLEELEAPGGIDAFLDALGLGPAETRRSFGAISADSRQVYRHMDIGTAKPTLDERADLPHMLIDIVDPDEPFSLATWLDMANEALVTIWGSGRVPIVVGGTGQYVWALLEGWRVPKVPADVVLRAKLEARPADELLAELHRIDPESHEDIQPRNVRRVIRALEVSYATGKPFSYWRTKEPPAFDWLAIGCSLSRDDLYARIDARVDAMFESGFVDEVRQLRELGYGPALPPMSGIGYGELCRHLDGELTLAEAIYRTKVGTHRLARHQNAWFKAADERIRWLNGGDAYMANLLVEDFLADG